MENLSAYLLPGEVVVAIEDHPQKIISHNNALTIFGAYLLLSSPFIVWLGLSVVSATGNSVQANMGNLAPPVIGLVLVGVVLYRARDFLAQTLMETRYVITNYRLFSAPPESDIEGGKWHGPKQYSDVLFADVLMIRRGKSGGTEYIDLLEVDESYDGHDNTTVTRKKRIFVNSADRMMDVLPPFLKENAFKMEANESADSLFARASAHVRLQRERLGSKYPSISNTMTKRV